MSDPVKIVASPLDAVYEKYKHLDGPLSDPEWCTSGEGAPIYAIAGELWRAVKEARSDGIPWCLCHEFDNNPACKLCSVRSICKQRTDVIAAQATEAARKQWEDEHTPKFMADHPGEFEPWYNVVMMAGRIKIAYESGLKDGAAAENKQVLDDLMDWAKKHNFNYTDIDGDHLPAIVTGLIINKLNSLRLAQPEPTEREPE